jgi:hypothetical protein
VRHIKSKSLLLAFAASFSLNASATLLNPVEYQQGSTTWLKLSETVGLSIADIESGVGGWHTAYRFATTDEIMSLFASFGLVSTDYTTGPTPIAYFNGQVGGGGADYDGTYSTGTGEGGAIGRSHGVRVYTRLTSGDWPEALSPNCPAYNVCSFAEITYAPQDLLDANGATGNFLVRRTVDVPEPGSFVLLGIAGIVLAARRRVTTRAENSRG